MGTLRAYSRHINNWVSAELAPLILAVVGITSALIIGWWSIGRPDVTIHLPDKGLENLNIALLCCIVGGFLALILALCWHRSGSWLVPSVLVIILGIVVLSTHVYFSFVIKDTDTDELLTATGVVLAGFAMVAAVFGIFFTRKVEHLLDIERKVNDVSSLTVTAAELTFSGLPDFTESHQIPDRSHKMLKKICEPVFKPDSLILEYLDKIGNGATLRYARGLMLFADDDYIAARNAFNEVLRNKDVKSETKNAIRYRLGITYRQLSQYEDSIRCFEQLAKDTTKANSEESLQVKYGAALTLYAMYLNKYWSSRKLWTKKTKRDSMIRNILSISRKISDSDIRAKMRGFLNVDQLCDDTFKNCASLLIDDVVEHQHSNYSAVLYQTMLSTNCKKDSSIPTINDQKHKCINELLRFLKNIPDSLNIKANYSMVEAMCYLFLAQHEDAKAALERSGHTVREYEAINGPQATIFSDWQVKQIECRQGEKCFEKELCEVWDANFQGENYPWC